MGFNIVVSADHDGRRLDKVLRSMFPNVPLSALMRCIRKGEVRVDSKRVHEPDARIQAGQELVVPWSTEKENERPSDKMFAQVPFIWKDDEVCIVNKPADLLVQPDVKDGDSVITRIWGMFGRGTQGFSPAAVHRLDRNTTGALAVAMSGSALRELERLFKERLVRKIYLAVVAGTAPRQGEIRASLLKDEENNFVSVSPDGKSAHTKFERISTGEGYSVVSVELLTGRTHQARVHLAHAGIPIIGDQKYGDIETNRLWRKKGVRRPLLHAWKIEFPKESGISAAGQCFTAPPSRDMEGFLNEQTRGIER